MRAPEARDPRTIARPYPTHTNLGKLMLACNLSVKRMAELSSIHPRTLTEYLAGRKDIIPEHRLLLAEALEVPPKFLG